MRPDPIGCAAMSSSDPVSDDVVGRALADAMVPLPPEGEPVHVDKRPSDDDGPQPEHPDRLDT